ncbi:Lrp/AsnC family transcriptional regulator [Pacificibacter marinus]|uniref:Regulatory protein AsnC n=1 Tax=Pacificibacter marinus TaxID=658057 RepID=A0A1Y5SUI3_9RHOB|nr:Lrp/AsnC family transcriptional regulator [Pacificibacter marinus]SEK69391.1 transcriptional regulator, AsnC family [Pacificibacter marinus]SLN45440.1 Regulatory protein AsnC [Pacificibacter marinus]
MTIELDDIDRALMRALCVDATQSAGALGRDFGLSQPATWRRIKRLREAGVFGPRRVDLNLEQLGVGVTVFLGIKLATKGRVSLEDFERAVSAIPEVQTVQHVLGVYDYRLRVVAQDLPDFERVLRRRIMTLPGVGNIEANVLLSEERCIGPI